MSCAQTAVIPVSPELPNAVTPLKIPASFPISKSEQWAWGSFPERQRVPPPWLCSATLPQARRRGEPSPLSAPVHQEIL